MMLIGKECLPQLIAHGTLQQKVAPGVTDYLVISPMGQLLGEDTDSDLVQVVFRDIASTIKELHDIRIIHWWDI